MLRAIFEIWFVIWSHKLIIANKLKLELRENRRTGFIILKLGLWESCRTGFILFGNNLKVGLPIENNLKVGLQRSL